MLCRCDESGDANAYDVHGCTSAASAGRARAARIQKINSDNTENNYLLEAEHLEAVYDENNNLKASYLRGNIIDEIISGHEYHNGKKVSLTFHHDQINSVIALSDHNGEIKQNVQYGPFGEEVLIDDTSLSNNTLQYTGRENDANGLYYYRARYYDPETGRFISEDPLGFEAGINFYVYVENNPLIFNDPMGLEFVKIEALVAAGAGAHSGIGFDTDTGDLYWNFGGNVGGGYGASLTVSPEAPVEGFTFNINGNICVVICYGASHHAVPLADSIGFDYSTDYLTPQLSVDDYVNYGGGGRLDLTANFDFNVKLFNVYEVYDDVSSFVSGTIDYGMDFYKMITGSLSSSANGGFVIYPNKVNANNMGIIYEK